MEAPLISRPQHDCAPTMLLYLSSRSPGLFRESSRGASRLSPRAMRRALRDQEALRASAPSSAALEPGHLTGDLGKHPNKARIAVVSELARWMWAIGLQVQAELAAKAEGGRRCAWDGGWVQGGLRAVAVAGVQ